MRITFVKKINLDGSFCKKCADVQQKMDAAGQNDMIDEVLIADERDPSSPGVELASLYNVERAPFFLVEREGEAPEIYTVYFKFVKEVLNQQTKEEDELKEILNDNPDLDFL
ncbi:MAG: hypothetical protein JKY85_04070 [Porticoccus sp.]|nr:hypothetical protein [Porticoccus sp.]PCJ90794.1 MAG: hypothetical protein COA46_09705 [Porticoccaceae bacterium]